MCQQPRKLCGTQVYYLQVKINGCVSAAKKAIWHTSVLFTGNANSPFSTSHISITTGQISIKFIYFMPFIYAILLTKFEEICCVLYEICVPENCLFYSHFSSSQSFTKINLRQPKAPFSWINFFQNQYTYKELCGLS